MPQLETSPAPAPTIAAAPSPLHSGIEIGTLISLEILAAMFPLTGGFFLFGWRAIGATAVILLSTLVTAAVWSQIGWRGRQMNLWHCLWMALVLSLMLPAHLFSTAPLDNQIVWPILPAAGMILAMLVWLLGGIGAQRIQPSVVTVLILFVLFHDALTPRYVLRVDRMVVGDLLKSVPAQSPMIEKGAWLFVSRGAGGPGVDALQVVPATEKLLAYTSGQVRPDRSSLTLQMLIRDQMPPLEDLIIAGQSSAIGTGSAVIVIVGGLFLLYRGLIDFRLPVLTLLAAMACLLILPIPVVITDTATEWRWFAFRQHYLGWPVAITFMNYELLASPLLLTIFFLSNAPGQRPITRRGRAIFALVLGALSAILQLYVFASVGPYIALLLVSLLTPTLDRTLRPRTLV
ncbi:MAG: RnfABCDGE type electron transport complex subunit D [Tepidisphaeraceae bacterium]|jgi:Na+-translocating ferredoxin:NAD+ oxidoreductase RnfD subunit